MSEVEIKKSFLFPFTKEHGTIVNGIHDLQIDGIVRMIFTDVSKQRRVSNVLNDICIDKETIIYRQNILRDFIFNRNIYYGMQKEYTNLEKCYAEYDAARAHRSKIKTKTEMSIIDVGTIMRDYATIMNKLLEIYGRMDYLFTINPPTSQGLKSYVYQVHKKVKSNAYTSLYENMDKIKNSAFAFSFQTNLDDYLVPDQMKYIITSGKYEGEKFSLFKKKQKQLGKVDLNIKVTEDFRRITIDSFNQVIVILEDIFESLYDDIAFYLNEFIFFEFGVNLYDMLGEKKIYCVFPSFDDYTEYTKAIDPYLVTKYISEGYSLNIYGNDIKIGEKECILVVGPNNSGKTVLLRTLGIFQVFGQTGLFVPANTAVIKIRNNITSIFSGEEKDTDVGGRFEKEVIDIKDIIDNVNEKSLVIINEIFQSTFALDGQNALFDILNYFSEINVSWVAVTHLLGIVNSQKDFYNEVNIYQTTGEEEKFKIKRIED